MITKGFDVEGSFNKHLKTIVASLQSEINTALSTSHTFGFYAQRSPETFPSVRTWFGQAAGINTRRHRFQTRVQVDIFVKSDDITKADRELLILLRDNIAYQLGIRSERSAFHAYFNASGYFANAATPSARGYARLELANPGGWRELPQDDPYIACVSLDFFIFYR